LKKNTIEAIVNLDRRIIFFFVFLSVLIPFFFKFDLPIKPAKIVKNVYDKIEEVGNNNGVILVSFDFDPASKAELEPMAKAILRHMFKSGAKVVAMGHWMTGIGLAENLLQSISEEYNKEYGRDWVFLGWKPGMGILVINMGQNFAAAFPKDSKGNNIKSLGVTRNIVTLKDFDYIFDFSAGSGGVDMWVQYGQSNYNLVMGAGVTAVMAPDYFPYLQSGQLNGLLGGLVAAAQYEALVGKPDKAVLGMRPQSVTHIVLIFFIIFGNVCYFANRYLQKKKSLTGAE